jgi:hypothetical protein
VADAPAKAGRLEEAAVLSVVGERTAERTAGSRRCMPRWAGPRTARERHTEQRLRELGGD